MVCKSCPVSATESPPAARCWSDFHRHRTAVFPPSRAASPSLQSPVAAMKPIRTVAVFPTLFTLGNLVCGFFAIVAASRIDVPTTAQAQRSELHVLRDFDRGDENHNLVLAGCLIFAAMIFD